jgi:hypothetical protein
MLTDLLALAQEDKLDMTSKTLRGQAVNAYIRAAVANLIDERAELRADADENAAEQPEPEAEQPELEAEQPADQTLELIESEQSADQPEQPDQPELEAEQPAPLLDKSEQPEQSEQPSNRSRSNRRSNAKK